MGAATDREGRDRLAMRQAGEGPCDPGGMLSACGVDQEELLEALVKSLPVAVYALDRDGMVRVWNQAAAGLFGWSMREVFGRRLPAVPAESLRDFEQTRARVLAGEVFVGKEATRVHKDGAVLEVEISTVPLRDRAGRVVGTLGMALDISRSKATERALVDQANEDPLTGLANRRAVLGALEEQLRNGQSGCALVYIDLDNFKEVNDAYGHQVGDEVLRILAARLRRAVRPGDSAGRLGGDEFAVLLRGGGRRGDQAGVARVLDAISGTYALDGLRIDVRASAGVAPCGSSRTTSEVLERADQAMYAAKRAGGGGYRMADATSS